MGYVIYAEDAVWEGIAHIPDRADRDAVWRIVGSLVDDPYPPEAEPNVWTYGDQTWAGYSIGLPSGHGFLPYSVFVTEDGTEAVRLWPVVWMDV